MRTLTLSELDPISGDASGRNIVIAIGALSGQFVAGGIGAAVGGVAGGTTYNYAPTCKPNPAMSPSGLGGTIKQKPEGIPSEAWNYAAGRSCSWSPDDPSDVCLQIVLFNIRENSYWAIHTE